MSLIVLVFIVALLFLFGIAIIFAVNFYSQNPMEKSFTWLRELVPIAGHILGIVLFAVGGIMFMNPLLKLYVFGYESNSYFNPTEICENDQRYPRTTKEEIAEKEFILDETELSKCIEKKKEQEISRYTRQQHDNMINGVVSLFFGLIFWGIYRRRKDQK